MPQPGQHLTVRRHIHNARRYTEACIDLVIYRLAAVASVLGTRPLVGQQGTTPRMEPGREPRSAFSVHVYPGGARSVSVTIRYP
jgi:hypothetical protein